MGRLPNVPHTGGHQGEDQLQKVGALWACMHPVVEQPGDIWVVVLAQALVSKQLFLSSLAWQAERLHCHALPQQPSPVAAHNISQCIQTILATRAVQAPNMYTVRGSILTEY